MGEEFEFEFDMDLGNIVEDLEEQILEEVKRRFPGKSGDDIADYKYIFRCHVTMK